MREGKLKLGYKIYENIEFIKRKNVFKKTHLLWVVPLLGKKGEV